MSALTKMFIVLQLVFALAVSVLLVLMVSKSENYKSQVESSNIKNVALAATNLKSETEKTAAQAKLSDVQLVDVLPSSLESPW